MMYLIHCLNNFFSMTQEKRKSKSEEIHKTGSQNKLG